MSNHLRILGLTCLIALLAATSPSFAQAPDKTKVLDTMKRATTFMVEKAGHKGGYVWSYLPDMSRCWGEMEATKTMMWLQAPGTEAMGNAFLDAYHVTGDEFYYQAAEQTGNAMISAQHPSGGWNYIADLAGEESLKKWYDTIGKNGWRLEEFQHYYGNATFDDSTTVDAARYMLRIYMEKKDPKFKASIDRAIQFVLDAQYPMGGWPQRFPLMTGFEKNGQADYTGCITLNDGVGAGNVDFLILCYQTFGDKRLLEPIQRGMNSFVLLQQPKPQAGWALQYTLDLKPAAARTYEPKGLATHATAGAFEQMLKFYYMTGDKKFLARLPEALEWLDANWVPENMPNARGTHPTFIEVDTGKPLYIHRTGSNVVNGRYFADYNPQNLIGHYSSFRSVDVEGMRARYQEALATPPEKATADSPLRDGAKPAPLPRILGGGRGGGFGRGGFGRGGRGFASPEERVAQVVTSLNADGYWPSPLRSTSNPYKAGAQKEIPPGNFVATNVGDEYDTSPYGAAQPVTGISTSTYVANMAALIRYVDGNR